ncbi:MAG: UDP-N-acetylmuramate dehydrogenase [Acidimicrobiia bacterium]|nr:UDP-N-acetylmuramate dehydrogenase [Acidimicrobiia bacterium]
MSRIDDLVSRGVVRERVPLGPMTTYKLGGPAAYFADVVDREALAEIAQSGVAASLPTLVIGRGSNLVVADGGFDGLVIRLGEGFSQVSFDPGGQTVTAGGAVPLPKLARAVVDEGFTGLEFFVGVPGSVGGAVRQNAGCFGQETADRLAVADLFDLSGGGRRRATPEQLELSYRHSNVGSHEVVMEASFYIDEGDSEQARAEMREITRWRRDNQPGGTLNAGSVFKNPDHISAGELIDSLGLKGLRVGDVEVSNKHANFFVAGPDATSAQIAELIAQVKDRVLEMSGTNLEPEIQMVGFEQ